MEYLLINKDFAESNQGYHIGSNYFNHAITLQGQYVCTAQSMIDFPDIFVGTDFDTLELTLADFPTAELYPSI